MTDLRGKLDDLARQPILLVACDYDGTLAPIVTDPTAARPNREATVALRNLAHLPQTHVAVISGRGLRDLGDLLGELDGVHLVGSHGSEFDLDFLNALSTSQRDLHRRLVEALHELGTRGAGFLVEEKPASVAFHYRNADPTLAEKVLEELWSGPAVLDGVFARGGKMVVELAVVGTDKGNALDTLRQRIGASAVVFLGDDITDEDAFATLTGPDLAIKVGDGTTSAPFRVDDTTDVARTLAYLCEARAEWLAGANAVPIEQHALLSDQRTVALVTPAARITWLCAPRIDSAAIFAELLGGPTAGYFSIHAADGQPPLEQSYRADSMVVVTRWPGFTVTDFFDCSDGRPRQRAGRSDLIRIVEGRGRVAVEFAPRVDFGRVATRLQARPDGLIVEDSLDPISLRAPRIDWQMAEEGSHQTARAEFELGDGPRVFDLRIGTGSLSDSKRNGALRLTETEHFWADWAASLHVPTIAADLVRRSALTLKALCHAPTGAIAAAATTSLPETVGGVRNWDYRFCWLRDASMSASALVELGSHTEGMQLLDWILSVLDQCDSPELLRPLYTVSGRQVHSEAEIGSLAGYRGSRPVRVGNGAAQQVQLDVFGPIVDLVWRLVERDAPLSWAHWGVVEAMVQAVERRWHEPDHGIWEIRGPRRHHVHSKTMCWLTVDRALRTAQRFLDRERDDWRALRDLIAGDILANGYSTRLGSFTATYGVDELDAATLCVGLSGLVEPSEPRFVGTVAAVERELRRGPTVFRYRYDDGLPGFEGGFHLCTSWLIDAYVLVGRPAEARELFDQLVALAGGTGLLSEEYGPNSKRALGNHPQAYSHVGLIENALRLERVH